MNVNLFLRELFNMIVDELGTSDATTEPAWWKWKGDVLMSHAMLHVMIMTVWGAIAPNLLPTVLAVQTLLYFLVKEIGNDVRREGLEALPDSIADTLGVFSGGAIAIGLMGAGGSFVFWGLAILVLCWLVYPVMELIEADDFDNDPDDKA